MRDPGTHLYSGEEGSAWNQQPEDFAGLVVRLFCKLKISRMPNHQGYADNRSRVYLDKIRTC
jgi:hypothetical protein